MPDPVQILRAMPLVNPNYFNLQDLADRIVLATKVDLCSRGLFSKENRFIEASMVVDMKTLAPELQLVVSEADKGGTHPILTIRGHSVIELFSEENRVKLYMVMS